MTTEEFLKKLTPQAVRHIESIINTNSGTDYQKLNKLFLQHKVELNSFEDTELNITQFKWKGLERDRNWWWQLQALPFLNWYANSYSLQGKSEREHYFSLCIAGISNWIENAKNGDEDSPLLWHDHASAFRVRNLVNWMVFCHVKGINVAQENDINFSTLIFEHLDWLDKDKNYSKHTNHGFDQAMVALTIALMFDGKELEKHCIVNRLRLQDEINFAFTEEGVHKENSPGYQKFMLGRLKQLRILTALGEKEISQLGEQYIEKVEAFLKAITLPNGYLPMIGDTRGGDKGLKVHDQYEKGYLIHDYSRSGYVIIRGVDGNSKVFFILLKNTHESNYHRHDDDMMLYLFYDGEVVLGDGGLYSHEEKDSKRKHLRSFLSHSVPYINTNAIRKKEDLPDSAVIFKLTELCFRLESSMFGKRLVRDVEIALYPSLTITLSDYAVDRIDETIWKNFFFEKVWPISLNKSSIKVEFPNFNFTVDCPSDMPIRVKRGWCDSEDGNGACVSRNYKCIDQALIFSVAGSISVLRCS